MFVELQLSKNRRGDAARLIVVSGALILDDLENSGLAGDAYYSEKFFNIKYGITNCQNMSRIVR